MTIRRRLSTVLLLMPLAATAQVDTSEWKCTLCPFEDGYQANTEAGAIVVSDDAYRFGNATGLDDDGVRAHLAGAGRYASGDGYQASWFADDLGLDNREVGLDVGRQGQFGVRLGYDELPYRLFDTTASVFSPAGAEFLALPAGWVDAPTTGGMSELAASLRPVEIGSDRQRFSAGGHWMQGGLRLFADFSRENRDGVRMASGASFTQSSILPYAFDYRTDTVDLGVRYARGPLALTLAWYGSFFDNEQGSLTWEHPFFDDPATTGFEPMRMALEPDNHYQQLSLSGSYRFAAGDTVLSFLAASGSGEQDDTLLPYTVNPALAAGPLPRPSLDGEVDTASYALTVTSRPIPKSRLRFWYRNDERDNGTPIDTWTRVITDWVTTTDAEQNTPYSYQRERIGISGEYRLLDNLRLAAGYERGELDRDFQEVAEQSTDDGWGQLRWRATDWLDLRLKAGSARREIDRYDENVATGLGQNPLMQKYNLAYRYREYGEFVASLTPVDSPFSATLTASVADDSYTQSRLGMTSSELSHISLDVDWAISDSSSAFAFVGSEDIDADQLGSASFADPDWSALHRDSFLHYGLGVTFRQLAENLSLTLDYLHSSGESAITVDQDAGGARAFPDIDSDQDALRARLGYRRSDRLVIDLSVRYEQFETNDWALAGVDPDTIPTVLSLGADPWDYDVWVLTLGFRYALGEREIVFPE